MSFVHHDQSNIDGRRSHGHGHTVIVGGGSTARLWAGGDNPRHAARLAMAMWANAADPADMAAAAGVDFDPQWRGA
jgi:hypothetical protein